MRHPLALGAAAVVAVVGLSTSGASTGRDALDASTAVRQSTTVTGAVHRGTGVTVTAGTITAVQPRLRGTALLGTTVRARYGDGPDVVCVPGLLQVLNLVTGLREGTWTCKGLAESAERPRPLRITVS